MTKLYLTVGSGDIETYPNLIKSKYILGSYYYWRNKNIQEIYTNSEIILDSGVFTMFGKSGLSKKDIEEYTDKYIEYIITNNIKQFVEMDLDALFSYNFVLYLRRKIEKAVGRKSIPIWHTSRGKKEFLKMCEDYKYAGVGGLVTNEPIKKFQFIYPELNKLALSKNSKLHCMGFTPIKNLYKFRFYSSDSTSWTSGGRFGTLYKYKNGELINIKKPNNYRMINYKQINKHNLNEWLKYQEYCDKFNKI